MADRQSRDLAPLASQGFKRMLREANNGYAVYRPTMFVTNNAGVYALEDFHIAINRIEGTGKRPEQQLAATQPPVAFAQTGLIVGLGGTLSANRRGTLMPLLQLAHAPIGRGPLG